MNNSNFKHKDVKISKHSSEMTQVIIQMNISDGPYNSLDQIESFVLTIILWIIMFPV